MCSKPISAKAERSKCTCSSPHKKISRGEKARTGKSASLVSAAHSKPTLLLFGSPNKQAQVCGAEIPFVCLHLQRPQGLHREQLRKAFATAQVCHYEWYGEDKKGSVRLCRTGLVPLSGPQGKVTQVLSVTRDISDWGMYTKPSHLLFDGGKPKTFAQILLAARETEKREIAKALHDEIGMASVMLAALVEIAKQNVRKGDVTQTLQDLDRLQLQTQQSMQRLRAIMVSLRPPSLDMDGALRGSLETLLENVCKLGQVSYRFSCAGRMSEKGISDRVKIVLYRIVQEALNNVIKHAQAKEVLISLKREKGKLFLTIQDDGVGFNPPRRNCAQHVGLLAMKNSVLLLGGQFNIVSAPGKGTCIRAVCPCVVYEENE